MRYVILGIIGMAPVLGFAGAAFAQQGTGRQPWEYEHMMGWGGWGGFFFGPLFMILLLVITIVAVVLVLRALGIMRPHEQHRSHDDNDKALSILRQRFAGGEIDEAEFGKRKQALTK